MIVNIFIFQYNTTSDSFTRQGIPPHVESREMSCQKEDSTLTTSVRNDSDIIAEQETRTEENEMTQSQPRENVSPIARTSDDDTQVYGSIYGNGYNFKERQLSQN